MAKKNLHPERVDCTITCVCGASFTTKSNKASHFVETCSNCSPAYNESKKQQVSKSGKADKFKKKYNLN